jgi:CDP-diacylglycerol--serine O-phosphatidyltransferase
MRNMLSEPDNKRRRRGIYLLPNLFTTAALFSGFYAIVAGMSGRFESAAIAIFVAMVLDGVDGRVARMTNTESAFGAEYDSLSDMVAFGLAPALVLYMWTLSTLGKVGWLAAFFYAAATALRLARFNIQVGETDKRYFQGLPCPSAAAVAAGLLWVGADYGLGGLSLGVVSFFTAIVLGVLMVSNIRYRSFKEFDPRERVPFIAVLVVVLVISFVSIDPALILFSAFMAYALSGPITTLIGLRHRYTTVADVPPDIEETDLTGSEEQSPAVLDESGTQDNPSDASATSARDVD